MKTRAQSSFSTLWCSSIVIGALGVAIATTTSAQAQSPEFSGYMMGDYYYVVSSNMEDLEGRNGFWFRRIYFTLDHKISDTWSTRLRTEMGQPGDFDSRGLMVPFVKDAYLKWKRDGHEVLFGMSSTPIWSRVESMWGYRSVEKTALDLYRYGSSRDFGLAAKGKLGAESNVAYHVQVGNGASTRSEVNKGKKAAGSLAYAPSGGLTIEAYADYESVSEENSRYTVQGAAFYVVEGGRGGVQFARQTDQTDGEDDQTFDVLSVFGVLKVSENANVFGRFDHQFQMNPRAESIPYFPFASASETSFIIGGVDFAFADDVHFIPNLEVAVYSNEEGESPDPDVMARLTVFYKF